MPGQFHLDIHITCMRDENGYLIQDDVFDAHGYGETPEAARQDYIDALNICHIIFTTQKTKSEYFCEALWAYISALEKEEKE